MYTYIWAHQFTHLCLLKNLTHERIKIYLVLSNTIMTKYITGKIWLSWDLGSSHRVFRFSWFQVRKLVGKDRWILKETSRAVLATDLNLRVSELPPFVSAFKVDFLSSLSLWVHKWRKDFDWDEQWSEGSEFYLNETLMESRENADQTEDLEGLGG